jgi:hypothetical protein
LSNDASGAPGADEDAPKETPETPPSKGWGAWDLSLRTILGTLLAAGGFVTFVAAAGGAVVWVRFYAAELPADQALAALPRGQLVASGAIMLAIFVFLGAVAAVAVYLFEEDVGKREYRERGVVRGLITLVTVEALIIVALGREATWERRLVAGEVIVVLALVGLLIVRWRESRLADHLEQQKTGSASEPDGRLVLGGLALVAILIVVAIEALHHDWQEQQAIILAVALFGLAAAIYTRWVVDGFDDPSPLRTDTPPLSDVELKRRVGKVGIQALALAAIVLSTWIVQQFWIGATLVAAVLLGLAAWRASKRADFKYLPCGIAIFVSVPLLGVVAGVTRNFADPQVQPVAILRQDDGPAEALQGIYVTETDDRVYFASIGTVGCSGELAPASGRLFSIPRKEVVAMSLGPPQSVEDAGAKALEMYYALAPSAGDPLATRSSADGSADSGPNAQRAKRRLEDLGPALRRDFDIAPDVVPPSAREGEEISLTRANKPRTARRTVLVGGVVAAAFEQRLPWKVERKKGKEKEVLKFNVPRAAGSGRVTVECGSLTGEPAVRLRKEPAARVLFRLDAGSDQVVLDGRRSTDDGGRITAWSWQVEGQDAGHARRLIRSVSHDDGLYDLSLRVTDDEGDVDRSPAWMWRLPEDRLPLDLSAMSERDAAALRELRRVVRRGDANVVLYAYPGISARAREPGALAERLVDDLGLNSDRADVGTLTMGPSCPVEQRSGRPQARSRVDLFVLSPRARVLPPRGCTPDR